LLSARQIDLSGRVAVVTCGNDNCCIWRDTFLRPQSDTSDLAPEASFHMKRTLLCLGLYLAFPLAGWWTHGAQVVAQRAVQGRLASLHQIVAGAVRDTNGDGLADTVAARVILPAAPAAEEIEGAANLAARLAFETTALSLPLVIRAPEVTGPAGIELPILVGRENPLVVKAASQDGIDLKSLNPGQGLIAVVRTPLGGPDGLLVAGGDAAGTLAAANLLASRLPRLWGMSGVTLRMIDDHTAAFLKSRGVTADAAGVASILVDSDRRGIANITVRVQVPDGDVARAQRALADLDLAHRRGLEPRTLNYSEIAETIVELRAGDRSAGRAAVRRSGLNGRTLTPPIDPDELAPDSPGDRGRPADAAERGPAKTFDLTDVYSIDGWLGDSFVDLIPDRTETAILVGGAADSFGAAHIAARLGLESTGVTLPIARPAAKVRDAARETNPILVGRTNPLVADLIKIGKTRLDDLRPGEGAIHVVPRAFGNATATVVAGADAAGSEAAAMYLGRRVPYVWDNTRGALSFTDVASDVSRFLAAQSGAGQASLALGELDAVVRELEGKKLQSVDVKLYLEAADKALETHLASRLREQLTDTTVTVTTQGITDPVPVFDETIEVPWEVEEFWTKFRADVLPRVRPGASVDVEARLSESPEYRHTLADQVRAELTKAGAAQPRVRILSAYKQGFLWLTEQVIPQLKGKGVSSVRIKALAHKPDLSKKYKFYQVPSRWLKELYPVDEIVERELGVAKDAFHLELVDEATDIYTVEALDAAGTVVQRATFSPKFVEREYLDKFPGWSRVEVTTGWLFASVDGATVSDVRIATDPERFWDVYQSKMLPRIYDHVMKVTDNRPTPAKQPFHRDLDIEIRMSEPNFRIGVDEEQISSTESLHEDLYFVTLDFFNALGRTTVKQRLAAPGKIFPIVHPERRGQAGTVRVLYAGNAATESRLEVSYREEGVERPGRIARELSKVDATPPTVLRAVVRGDGVSEVELHVDAKNDREAARAADAVDALGRLHAAGLYRTALSYGHVDRIAVSIAVERTRTRRIVSYTGTAQPSNVRVAGARPRHPVVAWDHIISPDESEEIVGKLAAYPEVKAYKAGRSYRGREISVMEISLPTPSELVSLAKLTALKPTIFITGRQHANEVSSTSHILRLGELLVTDPAYKAILKGVNIVLHPVENPDGAQMAYDLQKLTPTHMLHAGRYSALGMDVASQVGLANPLLPESRVRGRIWREWLPDIYLNPHGYPSHEWVQQFAGYVPPGFRTYWSSRGWYTGVGGLRDPRYPGHADAVEALREAIVREINSNADVKAMNLRHQARYRRWAFGFSPYVFNQEIYKDTAIYYTDPETGEPRGSRRAGGSRAGGGGGGRLSMGAWPQVTFVSGGTEAPDETAQGEWLNLVTKPGFSYLMAHITYLRDGQYKVERLEEEGQRDAVSLTWLRVRPVMPMAAGQQTSKTAGQ
jgi:hypothetical protein